MPYVQHARSGMYIRIPLLSCTADLPECWSSFGDMHADARLAFKLLPSGCVVLHVLHHNSSILSNISSIGPGQPHASLGAHACLPHAGLGALLPKAAPEFRTCRWMHPSLQKPQLAALPVPPSACECALMPPASCRWPSQSELPSFRHRCCLDRPCHPPPGGQSCC